MVVHKGAGPATNNLLNDSACSRSEGGNSAPSVPAGQVNYTVYCGRSCRAMTSMPMSLALP